MSERRIAGRCGTAILLNDYLDAYIAIPRGMQSGQRRFVVATVIDDNPLEILERLAEQGLGSFQENPVSVVVRRDNRNRRSWVRRDWTI